MIPARTARPARLAGPRPTRWTRWVALAPPTALVALVAVAAAYAVDRGAAPARLFLALLAAAVLGASGVAAGARARWLPWGSALLAPIVVLVPVESPLALALVFGVAGVVLAAVAGERLAAPDFPRAAELAALAFAAQLVVHGDRLWTAAGEPRTFALLALAPVAAALAVGLLARERAGLAVAAALGAFAAGPGWSWTGCAALAGAALLVRVLRLTARAPGLASGLVALAAAAPALGAEPPAIVLALVAATALAADARAELARLGRGALALAALGALLAGAPPWRRAAPLDALLRGVATRPLGAVAAPLGARTATLDAATPRLELPWPAGRVGTLVVDSFLIEGAGLACGTPVARLRLLAAGREVAAARLEVGSGTGEWAALRPDVAARLACRGGSPFLVWLPRGERFLGARWRARLPLAAPVAAERLVIELDPGLPRATRLAVVAVGGER